MHFSKSLLRACLFAGQWLFVLTAGLALLSLVADWLRGDATGRPGVMLWIGGFSLALAAGFYALGRLFNSEGSNQ
jgi:hypothetical protein